jgi:cysteine desulfurase
MIYLDNSTTTRPSDAALSKMMPFYTDFWGIPSTPHQKGQELFPGMNESYRLIYTLLGAKEEDDFVLTSSGAEAINHVIFSTYRDVSQSTGKNHFLTSNADEAPIVMSIARLERFGCVGKIVAVNNNGIVMPEAIADAITPRTALVSLSWANGLTGVIQPLAEIGDLCRQRGILLHIDATHVLGKLFYYL